MLARHGLLALAVGVALFCASAFLPGPKFEPAAHRNPPPVPNHNANNEPCPPRHDCPAEPARKLRVISIIPNSFPFADDLEKFGHALVNSKWITEFTAEYEIPGPAMGRVIRVDDMPDLNQGTKTVNDYRDYIFKKATAAGIQKTPNHQTIYLLYIPCDPDHKPSAGIDSFACVNHHPSFTIGGGQEALFSAGDTTAVVLGFNPKRASHFTLDGATADATHELAEAATDTRPFMRFNLVTNDPAHPYVDTGSNAGGSPWLREFFPNSAVMELGDMAAGHREYEASPGSSQQFLYVRVYSNRGSASGGDPGVPRGNSPYYNVSTDDDWVVTVPGTGVDIPVTAWSAADIGSWDVNVTVDRWPGYNTDPPTTAPCAAAGHFSVHNGSKFTVRVANSVLPTADTWCIVNFRSTKNVPLGDTYHSWFVGVHIKPPLGTPRADEPCVCPDGFKAGPATRADSPACEHICRGHERH